MGWMEAVGAAIQYIEDHITEELSVEEIAQQVNISPFYFQKGFAMLCGFTLGEYIRNRRLALAGGELATGDAKVIDIALKYLRMQRFFLMKERRKWFRSSGRSITKREKDKPSWVCTGSILMRKWDRTPLNI